MPPASAKRRKLGVAPPKSLPKTGIDCFVQVSKTTVAGKGLLEKNSIIAKEVTIVTTEIQPANGRKRKQVESDDDAPIAFTRQNTRSLPGPRSSASPRTPKALKSQNQPPMVGTPTKGVRSSSDKLFLASKGKAESPLNNSSFSCSLDALTPKHILAPAELPAELLDLINLHASFLTALSIHYAHNGTQTPADLRTLCPDVARVWGKRRVLEDDIRRTLGILNHENWSNSAHSISRLTLADYGKGKICVELEIQQGGSGRIGPPMNENFLNDCFVAELQRRWQGKEEQEVGKFISGLPMEKIRICASLETISPYLAKGQQRLDELRKGVMIKKEEQILKLEGKQNGPKLTLLERLRAKQLHQSTLPPPPTKEQLARQSALSRAEEVAAVLSILSTSGSTGQSRVSFTLPTILSKLKDSFKTPISKMEAAACVKLLAGEIATEWVRIVKMGKVEALVVNRDKRPSEEDIQERISRSV